ncbi:MAG TPA: hypothetical protein VN754_06335 [Candidatus Binataceae bacterium]|nr:hypothetical protein [Candidatus Binataceae bacterium]
MAFFFFSGMARAVDPSAYLLLPTVTQGEREIDLRAGWGSGDATVNADKAAGLGFGYGVTQHWFTEVAVQYRRQGNTGTEFDAFEWENILQLAEPGEWPVDVGLALELERPRTMAEGTGVRVGPLLQKEFGMVQANLNLLLARHIHSSQFQSTSLNYQGQVKYRYSQPFEFGLQAFGNVGAVNRWAGYEGETHRIGPVVLGKFPLANESSLSYNLGLLFGTTAKSPDRTLRLQVEYEF